MNHKLMHKYRGMIVVKKGSKIKSWKDLKGKKIAIGGNITDTTHAVARYTPSIRKPLSHQGKCSVVAPSFSRGYSQPISKSESHCEG